MFSLTRIAHTRSVDAQSVAAAVVRRTGEVSHPLNVIERHSNRQLSVVDVTAIGGQGGEITRPLQLGHFVVGPRIAVC